MLTDDESAELAELRRRAWSADADIGDDPVALSRLADLEAKAHPVSPAEPAIGESSPAGEGSPVVGISTGSETGIGTTTTSTVSDAAPDPPADASAGADARAATRRRWAWLVAAGVIAVIGAAAVGPRILTAQPEPSASTSAPTPVIRVTALPPLACGDGWGPAGTLVTPDGRPVWSRAFDVPVTSVPIVSASGTSRVGMWANLDVRGDTIADVTVVKPATARLFYTDVRTWTGQPSPDEVLADGATALTLPHCAGADSYPGFILAEAPTCVTLEFTIDGNEHYTVEVPVGIDKGARCPAP